MQEGAARLVIEGSQIDIVADCHEIPATAEMTGGVVCTGFVDVETVLAKSHITHNGWMTTRFFLEKKLPFQVVLLVFKEDEGYAVHSGDESDSSGSDESDEWSSQDEEGAPSTTV